MMKKINKILSWLIALAIISNASVASFAAAKRDVNDPVLREIINELSKKMPKFIDKYGETVFVEDEPITRGSLLAAIYEYDKRVKATASAPAEGTGVSPITKQEFDALRAKVNALEKSGVSTAKVPAQKGGGSGVDMIELINDLEPNMPVILDNTLSNSKVFRDLQQQVLAGGGKAVKGGGNLVSSKDIDEVNTRIEMLTKKVDTQLMESPKGKSSKEIADINMKIDFLTKKVEDGDSQKGKKTPDASYAAVTKDINEMNEKIILLSKRVDSAELNASVSDGLKGSKQSASASQKEIAELKNTLVQIQQSYVNLSKRIDDLDNKAIYASVPALSKGDSADLSYITKQLSDIRKTVSEVPTSNDVKKEIARSNSQTQADIDRIEKRLNTISSGGSSSSGSSEESSGNGATIATISLGITLIAALFVAR